MSRLWEQYFMTTWSILLEHKNIIQLNYLFFNMFISRPHTRSFKFPPPPPPKKKRKAETTETYG